MIKSYGYYDKDVPYKENPEGSSEKANDLAYATYDKNGPLLTAYGLRKWDIHFFYCECGSTAFHACQGNYMLVLKCVNCGEEKVAYDG